MKKILFLFLSLSMLLNGCSSSRFQQAKPYSATYFTLFDTVTNITGYAESEAVFQEQSQLIHDELLRYHQLFDIYNDYEGIHNLKTINDQAGIAPVSVDPDIIALLQDCADYCELSAGKVNAAMGSVLHLWHETRTEGISDPQNARIPDLSALQEASSLCSFENVIIDSERSTVFLSDPEMSLDVGAIAKGWAAQKAAEKAPQGMLISVGGNVCATGPKPEDEPWIVGIQDPDGGDYLHTIPLTNGAIVTSGDYQRAYVADGKTYHHIIDPQTCMPGEYWRSVTVLCADSALADALSTALFLLPLEEGKALASQFDAQILWIDKNKQEFMTQGFESILLS